MTCDNVIPKDLTRNKNKSNKEKASESELFPDKHLVTKRRSAESNAFPPRGGMSTTEFMTCHCTLAVRQQCHYRKTSRQKVSSKVKQKRAQDGCLGTKSRRKTR